MPGSNNFCDTTAVIDYMADPAGTIFSTANMAAASPMAILATYPYEVDAFPQFPSVAIVDMGLRRNYSGPHMFTLYLSVRIIVMHGLLNQSPATRQRNELQLARSITLLLHADRQLGGNIVQGWVEKDIQGSLPTQDSGAVKCSFLDWTGEAREIDTT